MSTGECCLTRRKGAVDEQMVLVRGREQVGEVFITHH